MKEIRIGDRVKFLDDVGTGVVTAIVDKDLVMVKTDEGFEYPVIKNELLVTSISEDEVGTDPEEIAKRQISERGEAVKHETEIDPTAQSTQDMHSNLQKDKGIDKDSKFYRKAIKLRDRERAKIEKKDSGIEEVDLHIQHIMDDYSYLSSGAIVEIQLARFRTSLTGAIKAGQNKIVYIHGKGAGKLKSDIVRIIDNEYPRCRHQDASFAEYGYGATLIIIK